MHNYYLLAGCYSLVLYSILSHSMDDPQHTPLRILQAATYNSPADHQYFRVEFAKDQKEYIARVYKDQSGIMAFEVPIILEAPDYRVEDMHLFLDQEIPKCHIHVSNKLGTKKIVVDVQKQEDPIILSNYFSLENKDEIQHFSIYYRKNYSKKILNCFSGICYKAELTVKLLEMSQIPTDCAEWIIGHKVPDASRPALKIIFDRLVTLERGFVYTYGFGTNEFINEALSMENKHHQLKNHNNFVDLAALTAAGTVLGTYFPPFPNWSAPIATISYFGEAALRRYEKPYSWLSGGYELVMNSLGEVRVHQYPYCGILPWSKPFSSSTKTSATEQSIQKAEQLIKQTFTSTYFTNQNHNSVKDMQRIADDLLNTHADQHVPDIERQIRAEIPLHKWIIGLFSPYTWIHNLNRLWNSNKYYIRYDGPSAKWAYIQK